MHIDYIPFRDTNYFSSFICDYLDRIPQLDALYHRYPDIENFKFQIEEKIQNYNHYPNRDVLVTTLQQQYRGIDASEKTLNNIDCLASQHTFTITTGHQLNLFTGPIYFVYKICSAIALTKQLKAVYPEYNFVPVYWMASEDHDFDEINFFNFKGKKVQWNRPSGGPVGRFNTDGLDAVFAILESEFGRGNNASELKQLFKNAYLEHATLADATRYLVNALFGTHGVVILDADDSALKRLFIPQLQQELLKQTAYKQVQKTNTTLSALGYRIQVNPREINLFYMTDTLRERIRFEDGVFKVNNTNIQWTADTLLEHLEVSPECFSPNVIMRPLYQEVILPNLCYIGGGGELAYWFQLKTNFEAHNVTFPILLLRNSVLVATQKQSDKQKNLDISNTDLFLKQNVFINKRVRHISNIDIDFSEQLEHLKTQFEALYSLAQQTDKSFLGAVKAQEVKQIKGLQYLEKRLLNAQKRSLADQISRATALQNQLFPNQSLQERHLNVSEVYLEYGDQLISKLLQVLSPLDGRFIMLTI